MTDGEGNQTVFDRTQEDEVRVIDGRGFSSYQRYDDQYRLVEEENPLQAVTSYTYDTDGNRDSITDGNENTSTLTYGARRNITSQTNGAGETTYMAYDTDDNLTERRDGRSSSSTDDSYLTEFTYDPARNPTSETDPLGNTRTWEYSDGTETAVGGGTIPAGLLARKVSPRGNEQGTDPADFATVYEYDSDGDLRRVTEPSGLVTEYDHDELGRITEMTVTDSEAQTTATTTYTYDEVGNLLTETLPLFSDSVSAESHQQRTTNVYDANSNLVETTVSDVVGDDDDRTTSFVYDLNDREISVTDPENGTLTRVFDENGNVVSVTDQEGRVTETEYDVRNLPITVTAVDFVDDPVASSTPRDLVLSQAEYDAAGRKISETDAEGRVTSYAYDQADRLTLTERVDHTDADTTIRDVVLSQRVYDDAGNLVSETVGDGTANQLTTTYTFDAAGRPVGSTLNPGGLDRATVITLDANGNPELTTVSEDSRTETTTMVYDETDRLVSVTVENGADDPTTSFDYDERGNQTTVVDPRVNATGATPADYTTTSTYDLLGRLVEVESPTVDVNGGPGTEAPTVAYGYDTFGNRTHTEDANGNVTVSVFDGLDRLAGILHPSYTPPGGSSVNAVEVFGYDAVGNLTSKTSRRGNTTTYAYDNLNRVVAQTDPTITGETGPGVTRFEYDDVGNQTAVVDPRGARVETGYDSLDRVRTRTQVIRVPSSSDLLATTVFDHDDLGNQTYTKDPVDGETHSQYNPASEVVAHQDQAGETTTYQYQLGRMTRVTDPLGRYVAFEYDLAGRRTHQREYDPTDTLLATTGYGYDEAGNQTTVTSPRGFDSGEDPADHTTTHVYDPAGRLVSVEQPANTTETIVTGYGYDLAGNLTRLTDGENNTTVYTYNTYNLVEEVIEPTTSDHPTLADRTWTTSYDAGGLPISETLPGGVTVTRTFDELGRLTAESGSGDGTAGRTLGYDRAGLLTEVDHPDGTIDYGYDDRGLLTEVTGPAGTAGYEYDLAGRMTERVDAAGTTTFAWTPRNELATLTEPATGTTLTYTWDDASQLTSIEYGTSGATRNYTYDNRGRLVSDSLIDTQPMATSTVVYGYDTDSNLTSRNVTLSANTDAGLHGYEYDYADRLISWTHPSTVETDYEWDLAGNRTTAGADTYTYDQRNRLISGPEGDYTYTPRGTLAGIDPGTTPITYAFDPFGRLVEAGAVEYTYDGLDRVAERDTTPFTYNSPGWDPISDNTQTYTRSPSGRVIAVTDGTTSLLAGTDRHGDLTHLHQTTGTVTNTALYDPYGDPLTTTGTFTPTIGYQGDWTDPTSGHVWQGARWYQPATGTFLSRDTIQGELTTPVTLNRYTYANNSPLNYWDPDGHLAQGATGPMIDGQFSVGCAHTGCHRGRTSTNNSPTKHTPATHEPASPKTSGAEAADAALINTARHYGLVGPGTGPSRFDAYLASGACFNNIACGVVGGVAETGKGLVDTFAMMYRSSWINAILDRDSFKQQWVDNALIAGSFATDPVGTIVNPIVDNITTAYNRGGIGQAFGSGLAIAAEIILGAKGTNRLIPRPTPKTVLDDAARLTDDAITPTTPRAVDAADDVVVLGKYPDYVNLADDLGARRFNVPDSVWKGMSNAERWAANQRFLDRAIARGSEIRLASAVTPSNLTGYYAREIEYLVKQGYRISGDDLRMLPPG